MEGDKKNKFSGVTKLSWWAFVRFVQMHERKKQCYFKQDFKEYNMDTRERENEIAFCLTSFVS